MLVILLSSGCPNTNLRNLVEQAVFDSLTAEAGIYTGYFTDGGTLAGSGSGPRGRTLTYTWSESGGSSVIFGDTHDQATTVTYRSWSEGQVVATVTLRLTVTLGAGSATDEVAVSLYNTDCVYVTASGLGDGSAPDKSMSSISGAIILAAGSARHRVAVAAGTYSDPAGIVLAEGVSLYGGYSPFDWGRDASQNTTAVTVAGMTGLTSGSGITEATVVDGFSIRSGESGSGSNTSTTAIFIVGGSRPVIRHNTITGGGGVGVGDSLGIFVIGSTPTIRENVIDGGNAGDQSWGISIDNGGACLIQGNTINGGGGLYSYGIACREADADIHNNVISGGRGSSESWGVVTSSCSPVIRNNTIDGGAHAGFGIYIGGQSSPIIENNIITASPASGYGIFEVSSDSDPSSVKNNDVFNFPSGLYYDDDKAIALMAVYQGNFDFDGSGSNKLLTPVATGNVSTNPQFDLSGDGWHLGASSPVSVTQGGLNGGYLGWGFITDKDGKPRTAIGSTGWSMGSYEY
ncbi:MAG: right-handed parallel beta-helix repeat-containing protein [Spirochaetes bacterium]|nr:right-handed parallel beta-helix repeat-containing protein [Spirochaetota bacterium]